MVRGRGLARRSDEATCQIALSLLGAGPIFRSRRAHWRRGPRFLTLEATSLKGISSMKCTRSAMQTSHAASHPGSIGEDGNSDFSGSVEMWEAGKRTCQGRSAAIHSMGRRLARLATGRSNASPEGNRAQGSRVAWQRRSRRQGLLRRVGATRLEQSNVGEYVRGMSGITSKRAPSDQPEASATVNGCARNMRASDTKDHRRALSPI